MFYYIYVLKSAIDGRLYVGFTNNLRRRVAEHNDGQVHSTAARRPLELVYYEACRSQADASKREKYLKSAWGKRYIKNRLADYLTG
jgi:putative endonuclease